MQGLLSWKLSVHFSSGKVEGKAIVLFYPSSPDKSCMHFLSQRAHKMKRKGMHMGRTKCGQD